MSYYNLITTTNQTEKDGPPIGITLRGLEVIDNAKARLEATWKGIVSCADILAYAAIDSVVLEECTATYLQEEEMAGFPKHQKKNDIPAILHQENMVACDSCTGSQDPKLNPLFAQLLKQQCPRNSQGGVSQTDVVFMNQSPFVMGPNGNFFQHNGLFTSDQTLLDSPETTRQVAFYEAQGLVWQADFVQAMIKMSQIQVLTGTEGEINLCTHCSKSRKLTTK
ncbi:hypothetical protein KSS87_020876 [Heliosperma pusillum]|nr:hypothetical protein KSS87_020876 [Heliosperma pusillum]